MIIPLPKIGEYVSIRPPGYGRSIRLQVLSVDVWQASNGTTRAFRGELVGGRDVWSFTLGDVVAPKQYTAAFRDRLRLVCLAVPEDPFSIELSRLVPGLSRHYLGCYSVLKSLSPYVVLTRQPGLGHVHAHVDPSYVTRESIQSESRLEPGTVPV